MPKSLNFHLFPLISISLIPMSELHFYILTCFLICISFYSRLSRHSLIYALISIGSHLHLLLYFSSLSSLHFHLPLLGFLVLLTLSSAQSSLGCSNVLLFQRLSVLIVVLSRFLTRNIPIIVLLIFPPGRPHSLVAVVTLL